jgi:hypothetical protein
LEYGTLEPRYMPMATYLLYAVVGVGVMLALIVNQQSRKKEKVIKSLEREIVAREKTIGSLEKDLATRGKSEHE